MFKYIITKIKFALQKLFIVSIKVYRMALSPFLGPCCRFMPTCSEFAIEAIKVHGCIQGGGLILKRLMRCHPGCVGGYEPVPPKKNNGANDGY